MTRMMIAKRTFATLAAVVVGSACLLLSGARPAQAAFSKTTLVYGPLTIALVDAYNKWLKGPLKGQEPNPAAFKATINASANPYTVQFAATPGHTLPGASYSVPQKDVLDPSWPPVPDAYVPIFPKGPITLTGTYARAFVAAYQAHETHKQTLGDAFAHGNSPGSGVAISTVSDKSSDILVGFAQKYKQTTTKIHFGCYKQQQFLVNPTTFKATSTTMGCPG